MKQKETVVVSLGSLREAIGRSEGWPNRDKYPVDMLEILMVPPVWNWWRRASRQTYHEEWEIQRISGEMPPENGHGVSDWRAYAGYVLQRTDGGMPWNRVRAEWYSHSPYECFRGVCRYGPVAPLERLRVMAHEGQAGEFEFGNTLFVVVP